MNTPPIEKKVKIEKEEEVNGMEEQNRMEQEEALVALIEHRTKEVEHLRQRITYYKSQVFLFSTSAFTHFKCCSLIPQADPEF